MQMLTPLVGMLLWESTTAQLRKIMLMCYSCYHQIILVMYIISKAYEAVILNNMMMLVIEPTAGMSEFQNW